MPVPTDGGLNRSLLRQDVYLRLRDAIVDGTLSPGEQLRDHELATWLGVSRTPVREALLRLGQSGLVLSRPGRSTTVARLSAAAARDALDVVAAMHAVAVRGAVPRLTDSDVARMRRANEDFAEALRHADAETALAADDVLHAVPVRVCGNAAVAEVLEQFTPLLRRVERLRFETLGGRASVRAHTNLIQACARGHAEEAAEISTRIWFSLTPMIDSLDEE
jgi:DNA-binding GntR family transcriptional regulator